MALDSITNWTKGERKKGLPMEQTLKDRAEGRSPPWSDQQQNVQTSIKVMDVQCKIIL